MGFSQGSVTRNAHTRGQRNDQEQARANVIKSAHNDLHPPRNLAQPGRHPLSGRPT